MPYPVKAKLAPKGLASRNPLVDSLVGRATQAAGGAVSDMIAGFGGKAAGAIGGTIGGEVGQRVGDFVTGKLSDALGATNNVGQDWFRGPSEILKLTGGLVFPNTPIIQSSHTANWQDYDLTHSNYAFWGYQNSKIENITVTGKFTINTRTEAEYLLGCIHFLRSVTKMHFGKNDVDAGTPPPVLEFTAMGNEMFNQVPCVVGSFTSNFEDTFDYVSSTPSSGADFSVFSGTNPVETFGKNLKTFGKGIVDNASGTFVPTSTILTITLLPYYNPSAQQNEFSLTKFQQGALLKDGWI